MNRDIGAVIADILGLLPAEEHVLRAALADIQTSAPYTPPEAMGHRWREAHTLLESRFGEEPDFAALPTWAQNVLAVWSSRTIDELRKALRK